MIHSVSTAGRARRFLLSIAVLVTATFGMSGLASAATGSYPGGTSAGTVDSGTIQSGDVVRFSASGFIPRERIDITVTSGTTAAAPAVAHATMRVELAAFHPMATTFAKTVFADADGAFATDIQITGLGLYTLTATGATSQHVATASVVLTAATSNGGAGSGGGTGTGTGSGSGSGSGSGGGLSRTGPAYDVATAAWLATGAIGIGLGLMLLASAKRRSRNDLASA